MILKYLSINIDDLSADDVAFKAVAFTVTSVHITGAINQ